MSYGKQLCGMVEEVRSVNDRMMVVVWELICGHAPQSKRSFAEK